MINLILKLMENEALKTAFLKLANMSISASWLVLAIFFLRLVLKKAPKWVNVVLWGIVAVRLICPFSIESALSLIPSTETIPMNIEMAARPAINSGIDVVNSVVNPIISASFTPNPGTSANPLQIWIPVASVFWLLGMVVMALYAAISYFRLYRMLNTVVRYEKNIFQSENVTTPFVLGIFRPRIYLPFQIAEGDLAHVVAHEQAHISRKDHWWKPLGFMLLTIHWFNPLMWLAYVLLCRDIELACDEKVIQKLNNEQRADYTQALVSCSVNRRMIAACPLAFGEVGVKDRVKTIMNYKKPTFWIVLGAMVLCIVVAVCFLTDPIQDKNAQSFLNYKYSISLSEQQDVIPAVHYSSENEQGLIGIGMVEGDAFARFLDKVDWAEKWMEPSDLSSPGSVAVNVADNLRITVYDRNFAAVEFNDEVCYYRNDNSDYEKILELLIPADEERLEKSSQTRLDIVLGVATIEKNSASVFIPEKYTVGETQVIGKYVSQNGYTMTIQEATHCENMISIVADIAFPVDREPIFTHPTDVILQSGNEKIKCKSYSTTDDPINENGNVIRYDFRIKLSHDEIENNQFTLSISGFSDATHATSFALESPLEVSWEAKEFGDSRLFAYEDDACKVGVNISSIAVNVEVYQTESRYDSIEQVLSLLKVYDKNGNVLPIRGSNGGSSSGRYMDFSVYLADTLDINSIAKVQLGDIELK